MRLFPLFLALLLPSFLDAQSPTQSIQPTEPQLSPQAAYDQATRPLDIIRRSPQNWSEVELNALKAARERAKVACATQSPDKLAGDDLIALAHLCTFAQLWPPVSQAAFNFLAENRTTTDLADPEVQTKMSKAYDYLVQADLNLEKPLEALVTSETMLHTLPYNEFTSEAATSTARYLHFIETSESLRLLTERQPIVLEQIKSYAIKPPDAESPIGAQPASVPTVNQIPPSKLPLRVLYSDAIALPTTQQFANQPADAATAFAQLEAALPQSIPSDDAEYIAEKRRQYLLLSTHVPALIPMASLQFPDAKPPTNLNSAYLQATVFLLFPDWCNQCVAMAFNATPKSKELLDDYHVRFFSLMAQDNSPEKHSKSPIKDVPLPPAKSARSANSAAPPHLHIDQQLNISSTPDTRLEGTPTLVVPNSTLDAFAANDFPLLIAVDHNGIIRVLQAAPDDALAPGGDLDQLVQHLIKTWPSD